uniref:Uncharacterized protein n=1 Tax=Picea glauca TaxID=3330 RepID=A0A101LVK0_PICGL|nr:hypothetical protein ABT39_MTgene1958 [Picea glauca]QHR92454.1 hypothetical protein Q903MT_gene6500 [Picea sitchensis]
MDKPLTPSQDENQDALTYSPLTPASSRIAVDKPISFTSPIFSNYWNSMLINRSHILFNASRSLHLYIYISFSVVAAGSMNISIFGSYGRPHVSFRNL